MLLQTPFPPFSATFLRLLLLESLHVEHLPQRRGRPYRLKDGFLLLPREFLCRFEPYLKSVGRKLPTEQRAVGYNADAMVDECCAVDTIRGITPQHGIYAVRCEPPAELRLGCRAAQRLRDDLAGMFERPGLRNAAREPS